MQVDQLLPQAQAIAAALAVVGPLAGGGPSVGVDVQRLGRHPDAQGRRLQERFCCRRLQVLQGQTKVAGSQRLEAGNARCEVARRRARARSCGGFEGQRQLAVGQLREYRGDLIDAAEA